MFYFTPSSNGIISSIELGINNTGMAVSSAASSLIIDIRQGSTVLSTFIYSSLSGNIVTVTGTQTTLSSGTQYNLNLRGNSGNIGLDRTLTISNGTGNTTFTGAVGGSYELGNITITTNALTAAAIKSTGTLSVTNAGTSSITGIISDGASALAVTKAGTGSLTLSGNNSYTGTTTINAGTLKLGATGDSTNTPLGTTGAGTVVASGATLDLAGYTLGTAEALSLAGTGSSGSNGALINTGSAATYSGLVTLGSASSIIGGTGKSRYACN
ncbi:MAG: hypothetical protein EB019_05540 [Actinobacteria bacterium]|nr:hypothetical protein [Actinomycetota bacterium]